MSHRPLRVLFVSHYGGHCGAVRSLQLTADGLRRLGVEVLVASPPGDATGGFTDRGLPWLASGPIGYLLSFNGSELRGLRLLASTLAYATAWLSSHRLAALIRRCRPDVVHCNEFGMFTAAAAARRQGVPTVMHVRTSVARQPAWYPWLARRVVRDLHLHLVAIDGSVAASLQRISHPRVIYNPCPPMHGPPPPDAGPLRVCFLCGLLRYKGVFDLLTAARLLAGRSDIRFDIHGGNSRPASFLASPAGRLLQAAGLVEDIAAEVRAFVATHRLGNVAVHGHTTNPAQAIAACDVLVFPSHLNGPGRSVFEAGLAGRPAIVAMRDRVQDIVIDGVTGLIIDERSPQQLAAALLRMADDPALRRRLGAEAQQRYSRQFASDAGARQLRRLYLDITAAGRRRHATPCASS